MKSQSAHGPAMLLKKPAKGPSAFFMKPWAGVPPLIQARALGVAYPRPKSLSRKGQKKVNPRTSRRPARSRRAHTDRTTSSW
jgi:hypothetical protein